MFGSQSCFDWVVCVSLQDPQLLALVPGRGPVSGGTRLTIRGRQLLTGQKSDLRAFLGPRPCYMSVLPSVALWPPLLATGVILPFGSSCLLSLEEMNDTQLVCQTGSSNQTGKATVRVLFGKAERNLSGVQFHYLDDPVVTDATPAESYYA